jgi:hypothetical protein
MPASKKRSRDYFASYARQQRVRKYTQAGRVPRSIRLVGNNSVVIKRCIQQTSGYTPGQGWVTGGVGAYDITIAPTLGNCNFYVGGTIIHSPSVPNVSELTALYDHYRIKRVICEMYYNINTTPTAGIGLPLIHVANDYNNTGSFSRSDIEQYPGKWTVQLGNNSFRKIRWSFKPRIRSDVLTSTGVTSTSALNTTGWIDTSSTNVEHLGTKIYIDPVGNSTPTEQGKITIICYYEIELKCVK